MRLCIPKGAINSYKQYVKQDSHRLEYDGRIPAILRDSCSRPEVASQLEKLELDHPIELSVELVDLRRQDFLGRYMIRIVKRVQRDRRGKNRGQHYVILRVGELSKT